MSVKIMGLVWDCALKRNEKCILLAYADHADHDGNNVYPSVDRIAWKTGYNERAVQRITKALIKKGILVRYGRGDNGTNRYRINIQNLPSRSSYEEFRGWQNVTPLDSLEGDKTYNGGWQNVTPGGGKMSPKPSFKPSSKSIHTQAEAEEVLKQYKPIALKLVFVCGYDDPKFIINGKKIECAETVQQLAAWGASADQLDRFPDYWWGSGAPTFTQVLNDWGKFLKWLKNPKDQKKAGTHESHRKNPKSTTDRADLKTPESIAAQLAAQSSRPSG